MSLNVGVVGASGMVGEVFLRLLEERDFPVKELRLFASQKSVGQSQFFKREPLPLRALESGCFDGLDLVFFSSGDEISREWAPQAIQAGAFAIDNSAAFRMREGTLLVVPEVNGDQLPSKNDPQIIANPNCSTIQLVVLLNALKRWGLKSVQVASYQSVSGGGKQAQAELISQSKEILEGDEPTKGEAFPHPIAFNCLPQIGSFNDEGYSSEEMKIMFETRKILNLPTLEVSAFTVRIPSLNSHAEAVWLEFENEVQKDELLTQIGTSEGLKLIDNVANSEFPHPLMASGQDPVFVGRVHRDLNNPKRWLFWVVADNLRKGAALNGIQIAERIFDNALSS